MNDGSDKIRITSEDLAGVRQDSPWPEITVPQKAVENTGPRQWGHISDAATDPADIGASGASWTSFFLKSWVYLALAGLAAAFLAWAVCEPGFEDGRHERWGNQFIFPLLITAVSVACAVAESLVERSTQKAVSRGLLALVLGIVLGFIFYFFANLIFTIGLRFVAESTGGLSPESPAFWVVRAIAWMAFGITGGLVYGVVGRSGKKCLYGVLGGALGAGVGGFCFDPISLLFGGAAPSRCIGMMIFGASTGLAIGLVESALKSRWLYVSAGPLAGKQFILYKPVTQLGSQQANDIYLFKDLSIAPLHASIELRGPHATLVASGPTYVAGQPVTQRVLQSGDVVQIGRYTFQYQEKPTHG